ncbi:glutathione S-transferase [Amanita rubescens]|nr:glutathione S-transferase [Amanita rubescens]
MSKAEHKSEEHLKIQPFGQVPGLEDDGFFLYESRAIARYIAIKYDGQATSIEAFNFNPFATGIIWEKISRKHRGLQTDEVQAENLSISLNARLDAYEKILSKQKYLAGDELTLADLFHLPCGAKLYVAGQGDFIDKRPNVKRWFEELTNRESWKAVKDGVNSTAYIWRPGSALYEV